MRLPTLTLLLPLLLAPLAASQAAAGGGVGPPETIQASQDVTIRTINSIYTINGQTSVTQVVFTQTFASTALGTWAVGPTPRVGTIGLGDIQGTIGQVKGSETKKGEKAKRGLWGSWAL